MYIMFSFIYAFCLSIFYATQVKMLTLKRIEIFYNLKLLQA